MDSVKNMLEEQLKTIEKSYDFIEMIEDWQADMRNSLYLLGVFVETELARQAVTTEEIEDAIKYYNHIAEITNGEGSLAETSAKIAIEALKEYSIKGKLKGIELNNAD